MLGYLGLARFIHCGLALFVLLLLAPGFATGGFFYVDGVDWLGYVDCNNTRAASEYAHRCGLLILVGLLVAVAESNAE